MFLNNQDQFDRNFRIMTRVICSFIAVAAFLIVAYWISLGYLIYSAATHTDNIARGIGQFIGEVHRGMEEVK